MRCRFAHRYHSALTTSPCARRSIGPRHERKSSAAGAASEDFDPGKAVLAAPAAAAPGSALPCGQKKLAIPTDSLPTPAPPLFSLFQYLLKQHGIAAVGLLH